MSTKQFSAINLTVVIPCYNHGRYLRESLASVTAVGRHDIEVIVVDDGSTDSETIRVVDELCAEGVTVIKQKNSGVGSARNAGIRAAAGAYILTLDADNRIRPNYIEYGIKALNENPRLGVVYGDAELFGTKTGRWIMKPFDLNRLLIWNYIDNCAVFRKEVWVSNNGYEADVAISGLEDWEFWISTVKNGWEFHYIPEVLFDYRVASESLLTSTAGKEPAICNFVAAKHSELYRTAFLRLIDERKSIGQTLRLLLSLLLGRLKRYTDRFEAKALSETTGA